MELVVVVVVEVEVIILLVVVVVAFVEAQSSCNNKHSHNSIISTKESNEELCYSSTVLVDIVCSCSGKRIIGRVGVAHPLQSKCNITSIHKLSTAGLNSKFSFS